MFMQNIRTYIGLVKRKDIPKQVDNSSGNYEGSLTLGKEVFQVPALWAEWGLKGCLYEMAFLSTIPPIILQKV